jgi:hypothetical protein
MKLVKWYLFLIFFISDQVKNLYNIQYKGYNSHNPLLTDDPKRIFQNLFMKHGNFSTSCLYVTSVIE